MGEGKVQRMTTRSLSAKKPNGSLLGSSTGSPTVRALPRISHSCKHGLTTTNISLVVPMLVPTINGYKRLVGGEAFWAPNAVTYGYDSRSASIRIISPPSCPPSSTRFEVRIPGADMNPYFALSAIILLGVRGIEKKLSLPGPPVGSLSLEDRKNGKIKMLPVSLEAATIRMMAPGSVAREVLGDAFVEHFGGTREHEVKLWNEAVTNWEGEFYSDYWPRLHTTVMLISDLVERYLELA